MKKITITLSDKAEKYFNEVAYSLDFGDGKVVTHSQVINHCLEELSDFELIMGESTTSFLFDQHPHEMRALYPQEGGQTNG